MDELIDIVIPVIKKRLQVPKGISRLAFQLNYRGLHTTNIAWDDPVRIELESYKQFQTYIEMWRNSKKSQVYRLFKFFADEVKYELFVLNNLVYGNKCDLFKIVMLLPQSKIEELTHIFYSAHQSDEKKQFLTLVQ